METKNKMWFLCPTCAESTWIPMGQGVPAEYTSDGKICIPEIIIEPKNAVWLCKCRKKKVS